MHHVFHVFRALNPDWSQPIGHLIKVKQREKLPAAPSVAELAQALKITTF